MCKSFPLPALCLSSLTLPLCIHQPSRESQLQTTSLNFQTRITFHLSPFLPKYSVQRKLRSAMSFTYVHCQLTLTHAHQFNWATKCRSWGPDTAVPEAGRVHINGTPSQRNCVWMRQILRMTKKDIKSNIERHETKSSFSMFILIRTLNVKFNKNKRCAEEAVSRMSQTCRTKSLWNGTRRQAYSRQMAVGRLNLDNKKRWKWLWMGVWRNGWKTGGWVDHV